MKILITIVDGFHFRYLVQTGILKEISKNGNQLIIHCPEIYIPLLKEFDSDFIVESIWNNKQNKLQNIHLFLRSCANNKLTDTLNIKAELQQHNEPLKYYFRKFLTKFFSIAPESVSEILSFSFKNNDLHNYIKSSNFNLIITSTPGQKIDDLPYLYSAKRLGIESVSPVYSWDNLTAKGPFAIKPDRITVWNEIMKYEAVEYHGYSETNVSVTGVPVFDSYSEIFEKKKKDDTYLLDYFKVNKKKKFIILATIPGVYYGTGHRYLAKVLERAIKNNEIEDSYIIIRPHPMDETKYDDLANDIILIDSYGSKPSENAKKWLPKEDNTKHLGLSMYLSDVVINIASTMTIDAACFNTPVINIAFDVPLELKDYNGSVIRYYSYTHYKHVIATNYPVLVSNEAELISSTQAMIKAGNQKNDFNNNIISKQVGKLDGNSYRKTANALVGNHENNY
jgi:hypothetical protein